MQVYDMCEHTCAYWRMTIGIMIKHTIYIETGFIVVLELTNQGRMASARLRGLPVSAAPVLGVYEQHHGCYVYLTSEDPAQVLVIARHMLYQMSQLPSSPVPHLPCSSDPQLLSFPSPQLPCFPASWSPDSHLPGSHAPHLPRSHAPHLPCSSVLDLPSSPAPMILSIPAQLLSFSWLYNFPVERIR